MIGLRAGLSIWIATQPVDFRRGMDSLAMLVSEAFGADPFDGGLYVFRSKRRDRVKILTWDGSRPCPLLQKNRGAVHLAADQGWRHAANSCSALGAARWFGLEACADANCGSASTSWLILIKSRSSLMRSCCRITLHE